MTAIGYIGLGAMGAPMLDRLVQQNAGPCFCFDADLQVTATVSGATGAKPCTSVAEIAGKCDILFTCLPNNDVVREVYLGAGGIASTIRPGSVTIDCSTISPEVSQEAHDRLANIEVGHLDASMLGSVAQANEGTISFVVGGTKEAFAKAKPALEMTGQMIRHCGPSGSGNRIKLLHQILVAGHAVAVAETLSLAQSLGVDEDIFYDIVTGGTGFAYSRYFEKRVPRIREGEFSALFMLRFMLKDARLARDMAADASDLPMLSAVIDTLGAGVDKGLGDEDFSAAYKVARARLSKSGEE